MTAAEDLTRRAYNELMVETKRASEIADKVGVGGWKKRELKPNKRFLQTTLISSLKSNKRTKGPTSINSQIKDTKRKKYDKDTERTPSQVKPSHKHTLHQRKEQSSSHSKTK